MGEIVQLKKTRIPRAKDAFYQAIPVNEIQGMYFSFARQKMDIGELAKRERAKAEALAAGLPENRNFEIIHNPAYGEPGPLAYRVWTGIEKLLSDLGSDFDGRLKLSKRQITSLANRKTDGRVGEEIALAIDQLEHSSIIYWHDDPIEKNEDGSPKIIEEKFSLIDKVSRLRDDKRTSPHYYVITVSDIVLGFLYHDRYFFCMSWNRVKDLPPQSQSVARILYRYMSYRYSGAKTERFLYQKDYATMCSDWFGGVKPLGTKSQITQKHLAPRFDPIIDSGLLESYAIEKNKNKTGFNVLFVPGKEFFADFANFYKKQLPLDFGAYKSAHDPHLGRPESNLEDGCFALLGYFHEHWFGSDATRDYVNSEIEFAQSLLKESSLEDTKRFIDWALQKARETNFKMQVFGGLKQYQAMWKQERSREENRLQKLSEQHAYEHEQKLKRDYQEYRQVTAQGLLDALSPEDREALTEQARQQADLQLPTNTSKQTPGSDKLISGFVLSIERRLICEQHDVVDFATWKKEQSHN